MPALLARGLAVALLVAGALSYHAGAAAEATDVAGARDVAAPQAQGQPPRPDAHDDSRVGVQLVVAGIAAGVVVGVGLAGYALRRKLGRTAYAPPEQGDAHH